MIPPGNPDSRARCDGPHYRGIFLKWELLRVLYNLVLVLFIVLGLAPQWRLFVDSPRLWKTLIAGAVWANIFYFAGPALESYLAWLHVRGRIVTLVLFALGLIMAVFLASAVLWRFAIPQLVVRGFQVAATT